MDTPPKANSAVMAVIFTLKAIPVAATAFAPFVISKAPVIRPSNKEATDSLGML